MQIIEEIRIKYENAKHWFHTNYDNPKESKRALDHYREMADLLYYFEHGERLRDHIASRDQDCGDGLHPVDLERIMGTKRFINRECVK